MALRAICVAGRGKPNRSSMIGVAGSAGGREFLRCMVNRTVMAGQTFPVSDFFAEKSHLCDVASGTLLREHGVRRRQGSRRIDSAISSYAIPRKPEDRKRRQRHRENELPVAERAGSLEILEVDSLREFLGCACSWHEIFILVPQRHHRMHGAEQN
jgi:hypothetical protein